MNKPSQIEYNICTVTVGGLKVRIGLKGLANTKQIQQKTAVNWTVKTNERESSLVIEDDQEGTAGRLQYRNPKLFCYGIARRDSGWKRRSTSDLDNYWCKTVLRNLNVSWNSLYLFFWYSRSQNLLLRKMRLLGLLPER